MNIFSDIVDFILPRQCIMCGDHLSNQEKHICINCLRNLPRTNAHLREENPIEQLFWGRIPIERATSLYFYEGEQARGAIHQIKYYNRPAVGMYFGEMMAREFGIDGFFDGIDVIIPLPLYWKRKLRRGYNQCDYIAQGIHNITHIPIDKKIVKRTVDNPSQTSLNHMERGENVKNVFRLVHPERIHGKHVLLLDDVITTGSTIISCAEELTKAGDVHISIISVAYAGSRFL